MKKVTDLTFGSTDANARELPLCVPQALTPRSTAAVTRGSWSSPRKLSEPKLVTHFPPSLNVRSGRTASTVWSFISRSG